MNKNISILVFFSNLLFYMGILSVIVLFLQDDNTPKWLVAIICVIVGTFGSVIPDLLINMDMADLNIYIERTGLLAKYYIFIVCFSVLDIATKFTIVGICIVFIIDLFVQYLLLKSIYKKHITISEFSAKLKDCNTTPVDGIIKYLMLDIICILLFINIHENIIELTIMLIICTCSHLYVSYKVIKKMSFNSNLEKCKMLIVLWFLEVLMLIFAYYKKTMVVCIIFANYYTFITDLIMPRKTSIFKKK